MVTSVEFGAKITPEIGAVKKVRLALNNSVNSKMLSPVIATGTSIIVLVVESNI